MSTSRRMWPLNFLQQIAGYEPAKTIEFGVEGNNIYLTLNGSYSDDGTFSFNDAHRCTGKLVMPGLKKITLSTGYAAILYSVGGKINRYVPVGIIKAWSWLPPQGLEWFSIQFYDVNGEGANTTATIDVGPALKVEEIRSRGDFNLREFIIRAANCNKFYGFGDSIGYGQGGFDRYGYFKILFDYFKLLIGNWSEEDFINKAFGNAVLWHGVTSNSSKRVIDEMKETLTDNKYTKTVIMINAGINDWAFQTGEKDIKDAVKEIMDFLNSKLDVTCRVMWVTPIDSYANVKGRNNTIGMYRKWITEAVMANVGNFEYVYSVCQGQNDLLGVPFSQQKYDGIDLIINNDGVHPNMVGYQCIGDAIWNKISEKYNKTSTLELNNEEMK